jgi:hypothetical protein
MVLAFVKIRVLQRNRTRENWCGVVYKELVAPVIVAKKFYNLSSATGNLAKLVVYFSLGSKT